MMFCLTGFPIESRDFAPASPVGISRNGLSWTTDGLTSFFSFISLFLRTFSSIFLHFVFFLINCSFSWNICCRISFFRNFLPSLHSSGQSWGNMFAIYFCKHSGLSLQSWIGHCEYGWFYANPSLDGEHCEGESWTIIAQHSSTCNESRQAAGRQNTLI